MGRRRAAPADTQKMYDVLGVDKNDSEATIKKAYRKLAMKAHPDKGGDPQKFQEIQAAWEILGDEKKRAIYDEHGEEGVKEAAERGGRRGGGDSVKKGPGAKYAISATLEQLYMGQQKSLRITRKVIAPNSKSTCRACNGQGATIRMIRMGPMVQQMQQTCDSCGGQGTSFRQEKKTETLDVHIPKGAHDGHKIVFRDKADEIPDGEAGDVVLTVQAKPHDRFKRKGDDLFIECKISLSDALCGFSMELEHLDGRKLLIKSKPGDVLKPCSYDPFSDDAEESASWECREDADCPGIEDVAEGRTDDPDTCKKVVSQGELKHKNIGCFVIKNGRAVFKSCDRDEALANMRTTRGATMYVLADPNSGASGRLMKAVEGEGMPRLSNPFEKGNLFLLLDLVFPAPGALPAEAQAALLAAVPKLHAPPAEVASDVEVVTLSDVDAHKSYMDHKPEEEEEDENEGRRGGGGVQCAQS